MGLINPFHKRMLLSSNLFFLLAMIAAFHDLYLFFFLNICLFLTSVNYWKYPLKDWRRYIDLFMVIMFAIFHIPYIGTPFWIIPPLFYLGAKISSSSRNLSSILHTLIHISVFFLGMYMYENECHTDKQSELQ